MCQTILLVFAGGVGLYLYYIVISGRVALPCLIFPLVSFPYFHCLESRDSMAGGRLINILPAALGRVLGSGEVFLVRPLCCTVMGEELGAVGRRSWGSCRHLTSMTYLPQGCYWGNLCSLGLAWPSNCLEFEIQKNGCWERVGLVILQSAGCHNCGKEGFGSALGMMPRGDGAHLPPPDLAALKLCFPWGVSWVCFSSLETRRVVP